MNFLPEYQVTRADGISRLTKGQVSVEASLVLQSDAQIERVLFVASQVAVAPAETLAGEARYNGTVSYRALVVDKNGKNHCLEHLVDFNDKMLHDSIVQSTKPIFGCQIVDTDTLSVLANELRLATVVEISLDAVQSTDISYLTTGGDGVYTNNQPIQSLTHTHDVSDNFVLTDSFVDAKATKLHCAEWSVHTKGSQAGLDVVTVQGVVIGNLCYEIEGDIFKNSMISIPFVQEIATPNATDQSNAVAFLEVRSFRVGQPTEEGHMSIEAQLSARVVVFANASFSPVVDVFSVTHELVATKDRLELDSFDRQLFCEERIEGSVTLGDQDPLADTVMAITENNVIISNTRNSGNSIVVEGVLKTNIAYYNADQNTKNNVRAELPFSISIPDNLLADNDKFVASGSVLSTTAKLRRGNEIDVRADVGFVFAISKSQEITVIKDLQLGDERELPNSAFSIHIAKVKETLWDIAKALGVTPEQILMQNPSVTMPLLGGERIIAYRQLNTNK